MKPNENLEDLSSSPFKNFETDTQKLVRRHLEDPNHVITDEEIRNLKVGIHSLPSKGKTLTEERDES